jgi:mRNA-degrading endonuclease HigB of HigAB toxin-antitoxin module
LKYGKTLVNGDAGEYFLAYKFTHILGWPCRLYGQDLGVDAELEILDDDGNSTGDIIKIQVKTVDSIKENVSSASIYVDDRHIEYWKKFCLPVIVCCVDLSSQKIYWKQVTTTEAYSTSGNSKKVTFCLTHDEFSSATKQIFKKLVSPNETENIKSLFSDIQKYASKLPNQNKNYYDFAQMNDHEIICNEIDQKLKLLDAILISFPWKISTFTQRELNRIRSQVRGTRIDIGQSTTDLINGG